MRKFIFFLPIIAGILWGSAGVFVRELQAFGMDGFTILALRMTLAVLIMFIGIVFVNPSLLSMHLKDLWVFAGCGLLGIFGLNYFYNEAVGEISMSLSAILLSMAPVFVMIISSFLFKEDITRKKVICLLAAFIGCAMASGIFEASSGGGLSITARGVVMGILSGFFCALYGIFSKLAANKNYGIATILFYSLLLCSVILIPLTDYNLAIDFLASHPMKSSIFSICHSLCTAVLPYLFYSFALLYMENGKVSILAGGGEPMAAVIFGLIFFMEIPSTINLLGLTIVIMSLMTLSLPNNQNPLFRIIKLPFGILKKH